MKRLSTLVIVAALTTSAFSQGFWAPGACWTFSDGQNAERYLYLGDTIVNGATLQKCLYEICWIDGSGVYHCGNFNGPFYEYTTVQGEAVLSRVNYLTGLDTLYWLGVPGDRWWPPGSEEYCLGLAGMLEIQDTGHVVIEGIELRTWNVARLTQNGTPITGTLETITERIGAVPRRFCPSVCSVIVDCYMFSLAHYSDGEINIPPGSPCGITTNDAVDHRINRLQGMPNPGTDQLNITGLSSTPSKVEVRDALGRLVHSQNMAASNAIIPTSAWARGTYFITATDQSGTREVLRWVKQ